MAGEKTYRTKSYGNKKKHTVQKGRGIKKTCSIKRQWNKKQLFHLIQNQRKIVRFLVPIMIF
jgi:hypothetical protein